MAKKKSNRINPVILALICGCLLFAMYISLSTLALGLWGQTVMGTVDSYDSRLDDTDAGANRTRTISKGYYFTVDGKEYRGYVMYSSDEAWPRLEESETRSERINYFSFCPYINKPSMLTDFDQMGVGGMLYNLLAPPVCGFLFLLVIGKLGKKKKVAKKGVVAENINTRRNKDMCGAATNSKNVHPASVGSSDIQERDNIRSSNLVGFSDRCNNPEILATAKSNRKSSIGCMWILVFVPLMGFPIAGLIMEDFPLGEAVVIGFSIAFIMLIVNLYGLRRSKQPMWEGVVTNKISKERHHHHRTSDEPDSYTTYTEYTTVIRTNMGKEKKIIERDSQRDMYDYLDVGDRVRYHPTFGTYEKYDKSKDRIIYCNICRMMNPIGNDRCKRCNNLLFK